MDHVSPLAVGDPRRYRWLPLLIIAMTLLALAAGAASLRFVERRLVAATGEELTLAAAEVAEKLDRMLFERQGDVQMMARAFALRASDPRYLSVYLTWMKEEYAPVYLWLGVTDIQGTMVAATEPSLVGRDYRLAPWFSRARATRRIDVADVGVQEADNGTETIAFTAPILDSSGTFLGVVTSRVAVPILEEVTTRTIRSLENRQGGGSAVEYQMLTQQGDVFVDSDLSREGSLNLKALGLPSALHSESGVPGFVEEQHLRRGVQVVTGYAQTSGHEHFSGLKWSVFVRMNRDDILAPIRTFLWEMGVLGGAVWLPMLALLLWSTAVLRREHRQAQQESAWAKAAESALLQSQERNRAVVETALDAVVTIDSQGLVTEWNGRAEHMFGWAKPEVMGRRLSDLIIPSLDRDAHEQDLRHFLATGESHILNRRIEMLATHRDGHEFPVELSISPALIGEAYFFSAFIRDITVRQRVNDRLAAQYAVSRALAESPSLDSAAPKILEAIGENLDWDFGVFWRVDRAQGVLRCLDQWSTPSSAAEAFAVETWQRVFKPEEGLAGRIWAGGKPAWIADVVVDHNFLRGKQAGEAGFHGAFGFPVRIGNEIDGIIELFSRQVREPDTDLLKMVEDVGLKIGQFGERARAEEALRQTEAQLRQSQKMEAVGRLAGGVAHDFNNLLTVIRGYSELLLIRLHESDPMRKDMEEVKKAADRASGLTRQLLAFSRRQFIAPKVIDLNALITNMDGMLRPLLGGDVVELCLDLDPHVGAIKADPGQIEQVVMNLAVNSRDAMPNGGNLTIETSNVTIGKHARHEAMEMGSGPYVLLAIRDTGHGMDEETKSHLFEPFFTTKEKGKGTGLGLSTVYGIVTQNGGHIAVESQPGQGATFRVYFPVVEQEVQKIAGANVSADSARGRETILLVEDEPAVRGLVQETLRLQGYTVLEARHGIEALLTGARHVGPIHLLLTDVVMPQMSGPEVAEKLVTVRPEIKVLFMSGYPDHPAFAKEGGNKRATAFLPKPFTPNVLAQKVREVLDDAKAAEPPA